ncbi:type II secretion system protein [Aliikangiella coralliicola]|uniref:Type II secretion system protein n=1 Tax=Aliikangiella coralliicola TaxID=2592383 RepID=A0A545UGD0_9GAMM|nr:type II secretion system protein [Aliikangiella coralliicola]TQV88542.1 type II secretion system protein [Aliikangiella coralliicola]
MQFHKPPYQQAAFTLLELIIVVAVLAVISVYIQSRIQSSDDYQQDSAIEQLISVARLTQQLSMNDSARNFALSIQSNQLDILADGVSLSVSNLSLPINLGDNVTLAPTGNVVFNSLGETAATTINVTINNTQQVCIETSGYLHRC